MACPFFWYDVMTTDPRAAAKFYGDVIGWKAEDSGAPGESYTVLSAAGRGVAGILPMRGGERPVWMGYIAVDDVDAAAEQVRQAGGKVHRPPQEVPGVIRFAVVSDPQGAGFLIAKGLVQSVPPALPAGTPGTIGWRELRAAHWQSAFAFYEKLFGWTRTDAVDMGPMGTYQLFAAGDGVSIGGMMTRPADFAAPPWHFYLNVPAVEAAAERVRNGGGEVTGGPMQVPNGQWVVQARDPQGAVFGLVASQR